MQRSKKVAYKALYKWSERLNKWEYNKQITALRKRAGNKFARLKQFTPNAYSTILSAAMGELAGGIITPEQAISLLHTIEGRTELNLCMDAGF